MGDGYVRVISLGESQPREHFVVIRFMVLDSGSAKLRSVDHNPAAILAGDEFQVGKNFEE